MPTWMLNSSILASVHATTSVPGSTRSGTSLNMYCAGNSKSFALCSSFSSGRKKSYVAFFSSTLVWGKPIPRSMIPMSVGIPMRGA